ncbi:glycoside hydrolase family 6 protein [Nocardioides anomalus]|uniref:Glucanase n=1 Tax=Nocardioides anomalus TaxID=2712223 RepID=A0A6G6W9H4_9ACTN|nr:glycoside hydrolase family 6 protein [Nocardioides anomalus]QIG41803.1 glycoside hydrolase family 6 protein [Nocardioides anomalus]
MLRRLVLAAVVLGVTTGCGPGGDDPTPAEPTPLGSGNPFQERAQYDAPDPALVSAAKQAAADGDQHASDVLTRLDGVPTGIWLTPERSPTPDDVAAYVTEAVTAAADQDEVPVFVVYGVPDRDCTGGLSSGGLTAETYEPWVDAIAQAAGSSSVVVLEPDALPGAVQCGVADQRVPLLKQAVDALDHAGVMTYLDAGHSDWLPADQIAELLKQVGVASTRGFSVNVSNYQPTSAETAYAEQLSGMLGGAHYVVDTGRNGLGAGAVTDWCNPSGQALGREPGFIDDGTALDAYVWVKPPGESDGTCNGGPAAGQLWPQRAVELATAAGW